MTERARLWWRAAVVFWACLFGCPASAANTPDTNATTAELSLWFAVLAVVGLLVLVVFWRRGQGLFGLLGALFLLGSSARLWLTQPLWFPRLEISLGAPGTLVMLAVLTLQALVTCYVLMRH